MPLQPFMGKVMSAAPVTGRLWMLNTEEEEEDEDEEGDEEEEKTKDDDPSSTHDRGPSRSHSHCGLQDCTFEIKAEIEEFF